MKRRPLSRKAYYRLWGALAVAQVVVAWLSYYLVPRVPDTYRDLIAAHVTVEGIAKYWEFFYLIPVLGFAWCALLALAYFHPQPPAKPKEMRTPKVSLKIDRALPVALGGIAPVLLAWLFYSWAGFLGAGLGLGASVFLLWRDAPAAAKTRGRKKFRLDLPLFFSTGVVLYPFLLFRIARFDLGSLESHIMRLPGLALLAVAVYLLYRLALRDLRAEEPPRVALVTLAFFSVWPKLAPSPFFFDDYHLGEMFIPFQQFFLHGSRAYSEFVMQHGLLSLLYGVINKFFFGDTLATAAFALALLRSLTAAVWCWLILRWYRGSPFWALLAIALFCLPDWDRYFGFPLFLLWVARPEYDGWKKEWPFLLLALVLLLFVNPPPGVAILVAALPILLWKVGKPGRVPLTGKVALAIALYCLLRYGPEHFAFVLEQSNGTQLAFGLSAFEGQTAPRVVQAISPDWLRAPFAFFARFLKLYGWLAALWLMALLWRSPRESLVKFFLERDLLFTLAAALGFILVPYIYGRVGTDGLNRIGHFGLLYLGIFLPLAAAAWGLRTRNFSLFALLLVCALGYRALAYAKEASGWPAIFGDVPVTSAGDLRRHPGLEAKLPGLGPALIDPPHASALQDFAAGWEWLGRTNFYDFTNRQNHFYLTRTQASQLYPSFLLATNETVQKRTIAAMKRFRAPGAWIAPQHDHEAVPMSVRAYRVFRWFVTEAPVRAHWKQGETEFVKLDWQFGARNPDAVDAMLPAFTKFSRGLQRLPALWGRNWENLKSRFVEVVDLRPAPVKSGDLLDLPDRIPFMADFLYLEAATPLAQDETFVLEILGKQGIVLQKIDFWGTESTHFLVPVGALAQFWNSQAESLRITTGATGKFRVEWLRLTD